MHFTLPAGWKIATPWDPGAGETFRANSLQRLIDNTIVIGQFSSTEIRVGAFDVTVATPGLNESPPLLAKALAHLILIFGGEKEAF